MLESAAPRSARRGNARFVLLTRAFVVRRGRRTEPKHGLAASLHSVASLCWQAVGRYFGSKATSGLCQPLIAITYIETHLLHETQAGGVARSTATPARSMRSSATIPSVHGCAHRYLEFEFHELVYSDPPLKRTRTFGAVSTTRRRTMWHCSCSRGLSGDGYPSTLYSAFGARQCGRTVCAPRSCVQLLSG